jgi:Holliday junction resolvasome RuvABC endonuclease subunit
MFNTENYPTSDVRAPSTILGLDLSLVSTGYCKLNDANKLLEKGTLKFPKLKGMPRLDAITSAITSAITELTDSPSLIVIEGYSMGSKGSRVFSIGELGGIIKYMLWKKNYKIVIVPPKTLKKFITNNGNAGKELMLLKTYKKYGVEFSDNNECDAFGLAKIGQAILFGSDIEYEKECLKKIEILN